MVNRVDTDKRFMKMAFTLAKKGLGSTSPNPLVGAVIVKDGNVIGSGYHERAGSAHAEINALRDAGGDTAGATLYINLEPCNHYGKTPPCTPEIIKSKISRVVIGMEDPNPVVSGRGIKRLRDAGIEVSVRIMKDESIRLNEAYVKFITTKTPFVTLKIASTLDGKTADASGNSKWITGESSRRMVHRIRSWVDAVLVGVGTVKRDDPLLTVRNVKGTNPHRIVVDSRLSIPLNSSIIKRVKDTDTIIATTYKAPVKRVEEVRKKGVELVFLPYKENGVDLNGLMEELGERDISSLLIEGGTRLATSALRQGIVDKLLFFFAPKVLGGVDSYPIFRDIGISELKDSIVLKKMNVRKFGGDILVESYLNDLQPKSRYCGI